VGENPPAASDKPEAKEAKEAKGAKPLALVVPRWVLYLAGGLVAVLILLPLAVYAWRALTVRSMTDRMAAEKTELVEAKKEALKVQARDMLRLAARPLGWAVRTEMLRNNLGQIDDYIRQFVREPGVRSLILVGGEDRILLASDRKLETQNAAPLVSKAIREATDVVVEESGDVIRVGVPVMGFDGRLGVLVVDYAPPAPAPEDRHDPAKAAR
jgi:hypothetical protein